MLYCNGPIICMCFQSNAHLFYMMKGVVPKVPSEFPEN